MLSPSFHLRLVVSLSLSGGNMAVYTMDMLLSLPIVAPSALAPQTLETIPGSAAATPPARSLQPTPVQETCEAGPSRLTPMLSRRASLVLTQPQSYFSLPPRTSYSPSPSPATTPWERDRPRPPMLDIPLGTPEDPIFSNYPSTVPSRSSSIKGKGRAVPLGSAFQFQLAEPIGARRRHKRTEEEQEVVDESSESSQADRSSWWKRKTKGRRRAATVSHSPPDPASPTSPPVPPRNPLRAIARSASYNRRRASVGSAPYGLDLQGLADVPSWPTMAQEEARRSMPEPEEPFAYPQPVRTPSSTMSRSPTSPNITPRRSSLISGTTLQAYSQSTLGLGGSLHMSPKSPLLGLSGMAKGPSTPGSPVHGDDAIPHHIPPRRSSLSFGPDVVIDLKAMSPISIASLPSPRGEGGTSVLSASFSTEESGSAQFFSPSSSDPHPLSSATTSLSRSAKSGKDNTDGEDAARDAALNALKLQRSLEWEAKQTRHRRKLEKRRMILLELVETEVTYVEDLKALVEVYLPQLHALPSVPERTALAVGRNAAELLTIHSALSVRMVEVLKEEGVGYEMLPEEDLAGKVERVSRRLAAALDDCSSSFAAYKDFCAGSVIASTLVRNISLRTDYNAFERRCQYISSHRPSLRLQDLLDDSLSTPSSTNKSRLHFRDYLIMPIQRVCRYPLLLAALLGAADTPTPLSERGSFLDPAADGEFDVGVDIERALGAMRGVAEEADDARRQKESEIKTATVLARLEAHQVITPTFVHSLGPCRLIGSLDVLHHHPTLAPLLPPVKVKYLAAFLYRGYLVLAKVKKGKVYEAKHFLPLEVFEMIDIAEGYLPHSIRLSLREHSFDLAASCEAEKEVWAAALVSAREESVVPPFELPASVSPFAARTRRMSNVGPSLDMSPIGGETPNKRHTLNILPSLTPSDSGEMLDTPDSLAGFGFGSPSKKSIPFASQPTILLRRAAPNQRLTVDRGLLDVFSESCAQARSKAQMQHALFLPDPNQDMRDKLAMGDSTMLRRRRSFLDPSRQHRRATSSVDIAFSGEVKGSVIPIRPSKSYAGTSRTTPGRPRGASLTDSAKAEESATEMELDGADDTATSDFGTLRGGYRTRGSNTRATSSPVITPLKSTLGSFRPGLEPINSAAHVPMVGPAEYTASPISPLVSTFISGSTAPSRFASLRRTVRKSASVVNLYQAHEVPSRAASTPSSPLLRAQDAVKRSSSDPDRPPPVRDNTIGAFGRHSRWSSAPAAQDEVAEPVFVSVRKEGRMLVPASADGSSASGSQSGVARSDSTTSRPSADSGDSAPVYALGNGITNNPVPSAGPWGTLKRTLTNRSQRNSLVSLDDMGMTPSPASSPKPMRHRTQSARPSHSRSSSFGPDQAGDEGDEGGAGGEGEGMVMHAPRRRRSVRLLQTLGFTAM